jgi:beta-glucosidase
MKWTAGSLVVAVALLGATACSTSGDVAIDASGSGPTPREDCAAIPGLEGFTDWPRLRSAIRKDKAMERRIAELVAGMTLEEKVGQMVQGELQALQPGDVRTYHLGSVLNGGGSWPNGSRHATPAEWLAKADQFWNESTDPANAHRIPILWGIDAVHGHNNVYGATLFPHNIGLGAARDPCLVRRIGAATAQQLRVTGQDWDFAPTLAVVRDDRWGRTYEGFSEHPELTVAYATQYFQGMQSLDRSGKGLSGILATAKHYLGDGGTLNGTDQGVNRSSVLDMMNLHAQGYYGALGPGGGQTVMIGFQSWTNPELNIHEGKVHGSRYLITDVLKGELGFDGLTITDWNGHAQIPGCTGADCPAAVNAGIDLFMIPSRGDFIAFIANTIAETRLPSDDPRYIPMSRIDDAVTRILRVKMRAGLFDAVAPSQRRHAGVAQDLQFRGLAREAVLASAVLLKNDGGALPLRRGKVLVVGPSADSFRSQTGGWTITWQGNDTTNADFPVGQTLLGGIEALLGAGHVTFSADGVHDAGGAALDLASFDAVIAVLAENPYAEGFGDIDGSHTLELRTLAQASQPDLAAFDAVTAGLAGVTGKVIPVATVLYSGRPLYVNEQLNRSDAFVAAFLPGTEAGALAELLFRTRSGKVDEDFRGKLSYSWPSAACQTPINVFDPLYDPLFAYGYGLEYTVHATDLGPLPVASVPEGCNPPGQGGGSPPATSPMVFLAGGAVAPGYSLFAGSGRTNSWAEVVLNDATPLGTFEIGTHPGGADLTVTAADLDGTGDAVHAVWNPDPAVGANRAQLYLQQDSGTTDLTSYFPSADAFLMFDLVVNAAPDPAAGNQVNLRVGSPWPNVSNVDATGFLHARAGVGRTTVKIPLRCFQRAELDFGAINETFLLIADKPLDVVFGNVRWVPDDGNQLDFIPCSELRQTGPDPEA